MDNPKFVEPGVNYFYKEILKSCHTTKINFYNKITNLAIVASILLVAVAILYYKKSTKRDKTKNKEVLEKTKQRYILDKLKMYNNNKLHEREELINNNIYGTIL